MGKENILDVVKRYHFTPKKNVNSILQNGLKAQIGFGQRHAFNPVEAVFTYVNNEPEPWNWNDMYSDFVPLEISIPKDVYDGMERFSSNPNYWGKYNVDVPNGVQSIERGGYADIFKENIPAEYIKPYEYPEGYRFNNREIDWKPGERSIMTGTSGGKINAAWELKRNKNAYGTKEKFLDEITRQCKDMGFESTAECGSYFLNPTTKKKGLPYIMKSRFIHNKPPIVESVDPYQLENWRKKHWNK